MFKALQWLRIRTSTKFVTLRRSSSAARSAAALTAGETLRVITAVFVLGFPRGMPINYDVLHYTIKQQYFV
jgi:hypothetical protein